MTDLARIAEVAAADAEYRRCLTVDDVEIWGEEGAGLWYLMTRFLEGYEVGSGLGTSGLSQTFHRPMLRAWDVIDRERSRGEQIDTLDLWPRDHFKTWCERARAIRRYMREPATTQTWWHAVEDMAEESAVAVGKQLQQNKELRRICKGSVLVLPRAADKRFVTAGGFSLPANRIGDAPSLRAAGAGTEVTGGHSDIGILDDPGGWNDVVDNQWDQKYRWYQATVRNVVRSHGSLDAIMTRWAENDMAARWLKSAQWVTTTRGCLERPLGTPDYDGEPVFLSRAQIERKRAELGETMFALQMMNDATPKSELPWKSARESVLCQLAEAKGQPGAAGPGVIFVLSDPAPAVVGSPRARKGSEGKDEWATATVKFRNFNGLVVAFLLELTASRDWTIDEGLDECSRQMSRWSTNKLFIEFANFDWTPEMRKAGRRNGVPVYMDEQGRLPRFQSSYAHGAKNVRFGMLASWAQTGRFYICEETVEPAILERFFDQVEHWRPLPNGENTLPHDDLGDVVARCTDSALARWRAPELERVAKQSSIWSPFRRKEQDDYQHEGRYVRW